MSFCFSIDSDFTLAVCAVVTAIATIISLAISVKTLKQNEHMIEESTRPMLGVYGISTYIIERQYYIILKNFGHSPARVVSFSCNPDIAQFSKHDGFYPFGRITGTTIMPGQTFRAAVDYDAVSKKGISDITFYLRYSSDTGKEYSHESHLKIDGNIGNLESHPQGPTSLKVISETLLDARIKSL